MGCASSAERATLSKPVLVQKSAATQGAEAPAAAEVSLAQLGIEVPAIPGDVGLCGQLSEEVMRSVAPRYASWVYMNSADNKGFLPEVLKQCVKQCTSGNRAGALLLLWLVQKHGYSAESAKQFAADVDLKFWQRCTKCGPMRDWLLSRLPSADIGQILKPAEGLIFSQLFDSETSTYTYVLGCQDAKEAVLVDPVLEQKDRDLTVLRELGLTLRYVINTHAHADHITSGGLIWKELPEVRTVISKASGAKADWQVEPGEKVSFGRFALEALPTPGHTEGCVTWLLAGSPSMVFTGDALLIRGCGRTDFQGGDSGKLYDSVHSKIFSLPGDTVVYPGHDYTGRNVSTVDEETRYNPRLTKTRGEFVKLMSELNLPYPKKIDTAVPANMVCGVQD